MSAPAAFVLWRHSLRRIRATLVGLALLLAAFQFLLTQVAAYLVRHSAFGELSLLMPDFVRSIAGPSIVAFMSFTGVVALGYFHPMVIAAVVALAIAIGSEPAAEVESRFVDLTLARDLTRGAVVARTAGVLVAADGFVLALMSLGTTAGLACCAPAEIPAPGARVIASLAISLGSVMICWGGVTMAIASITRRRAVAGASVGVAALAAFLLDYLGRAWDPARSISVVSPFHYFEPTALIMGGSLNTADVAVLVGIGVAGAALAWAIFARRDI
ncbi:MAG TPA: hypothetical protein VFA27_04515 [Vicinamibacterales bacterium]|nr:hypothetical protein [Vicinamibacterales bacterium]